MVYQVLGLLPAEENSGNTQITDNLMEMIISLRNEAKEGKDYKTADRIRNELTRLGITLKDHKEGTDWEVN